MGDHLKTLGGEAHHSCEAMDKTYKYFKLYSLNIICEHEVRVDFGANI